MGVASELLDTTSDNDASCLTAEQCQRLDGPIRDQLELLDYEVRSAFARIFADASLSCNDNAMFLKASTTVLLSISANLFEHASAATDEPFDIDTFLTGAKSAAQWAALRKLRYSVAGEA